jgi:hypothetical protein
LAGTPDLVALRADAGTVYDIKTGKPRVSDQVQVMIYMYVWGAILHPYLRTSSSHPFVIVEPGRRIV